MSIHVQLERFEGPLPLLLYLIRREEMDIFDINVQQITQQYLEYIRAMKKLDLEVAGEFVAMAATLIHIKSRMLLPQYNEEGEEIEVEDPRKELVQKLLEYQKFQEISEQLYQRPLLGREVWLRGTREDISTDAEDDIIVEENPLFSLISAYRNAVRNMKKTVHRVMGELQSISARILEIKDRLRVGERVKMHNLVEKGDNERNQLLVTFLSMLELAKMGFVSLFQAENFSDIHIETKKVIDRDVIQRVDDFDASEMGDQLATAMDGVGEERELVSEVDEVLWEEDSESSVSDSDRGEPLPLKADGEPGQSIDRVAAVAGEGVASRESPMETTGAFAPDKDFEVEAATDEEIEEEEKRLNEMDGVS